MALEGELSGIQGVTCSCGEKLPLKVCESFAGYYLGYSCNNCGPWSRESDYFKTYEDAEEFLKSLQEENNTSKLRNTDFIEDMFEVMTLNQWIEAYLEKDES
jgi:hypothetical protein